MLAGRPGWQHWSGVEAVRKAATEADKPILNRSWDNQLGGLIQRCWDENPTFKPPFSVIIQEIEDYSSEFKCWEWSICVYLFHPLHYMTEDGRSIGFCRLSHR